MHPCGFAFAGSSYYKMWAGLNGFDPRNNFWRRKDWHGLHESSYRYRALAIDVLTVKRQNIVRPLSVDFRGLITSVWQKSGRFYSDLRNASTLELTLLVCHSSL